MLLQQAQKENFELVNRSLFQQSQILKLLIAVLYHRKRKAKEVTIFNKKNPKS